MNFKVHENDGICSGQNWEDEIEEDYDLSNKSIIDKLRKLLKRTRTYIRLEEN